MQGRLPKPSLTVLCGSGPGLGTSLPRSMHSGTWSAGGRGTSQSKGLLLAMPGLLGGFLWLLLHSCQGCGMGTPGPPHVCETQLAPAVAFLIRPWALSARFPVNIAHQPQPLPRGRCVLLAGDPVWTVAHSLGRLPCGRCVLLASDPVWTLAQTAPSQGLAMFSGSPRLGEGLPYQQRPQTQGFLQSSL